MLFKCSGSAQLPTLLLIQLRKSKVLKCICTAALALVRAAHAHHRKQAFTQGCRHFVLLALFVVLLGALQRPSDSYLRAAYMRRWVLDANACMLVLFGGAYCSLLLFKQGVLLFCCSCSNTSALFSAQR